MITASHGGGQMITVLEIWWRRRRNLMEREKKFEGKGKEGREEIL